MQGITLHDYFQGLQILFGGKDLKIMFGTRIS